MNTKTTRVVLIAAMLGLSAGFVGCKKQEETPIEKMQDGIGDALNTRDNEELKDAGEDAKDAMENAGDAIEQKAEDTKEAVTE